MLRAWAKALPWVKLCAALYALFVAFVLYDAARHPFYNWDMLPYMGAVVSYSGPDKQGTLKRTYQEAEKAFPGWVYDQHTGKNKPGSYGAVVAADAEAFAQQLRFYTIKPLFVAAAWLFHQAGLSLSDAVLAVSWLAFLAFAALAWKWRPQNIPTGAWALVLAAFYGIGAPPVKSLAYLASPDALSVALLAAAYHPLLFRKSFHGFWAVGLLALLARPENIILLGMTLAYLALLAEPSRRIPFTKAALSGISMVALYLAANTAGGSYGWAVLFHHSLVSYLTHPADADIHISLERYWLSLTYGLKYAATKCPLLTTWLTLGLASGLAIRWLPVENKIAGWLALIAGLNIFLRLLLFPYADVRFFYFNYFLILFCAAQIAALLIKNCVLRKNA